MNNVPKRIRKHWSSNTEKSVCLRADEGNCAGRLTKEHAIIYAGKQLQEEWAILDICEYHHGVNKFMDTGHLDKQKHVWIALNRATDDELRRISKAVDYIALRSRLNLIYG